jgi:hypothetical protein
MRSVILDPSPAATIHPSPAQQLTPPLLWQALAPYHHHALQQALLQICQSLAATQRASQLPQEMNRERDL